jgi:hypothetical protein
MTDLNNTELNTEFNTSRQAHNGGYPVGGGQTDRAHPEKSARGSARGKAGFNAIAGGGLTDRERGGHNLNQSLQNQSLVSSYQIS